MRMPRAAAIGATLIGLGGVAMAQAPGQPSTAPALTKIEILGNYAGRKLKLMVDGKVEWDGYGHLNPPGVTWIVSVKPGEAPAPVELQIDQCEQPFKAELPRDGREHLLIIQGCEVELR